MIRLVLFDLDGTLVTTKSGKTFRASADDWELLPDRVRYLKALQAAGIKVGIASNQGGVAFGYTEETDLVREILTAATDLSIPHNMIEICYTHPAASRPEYREESARRKPGPGMLNTLIHVKAGVSPGETIMIGDRDEDAGAAEAAGCHFLRADEFFSVPVREWIQQWVSNPALPPLTVEPRTVVLYHIAMMAGERVQLVGGFGGGARIACLVPKLAYDAWVFVAGMKSQYAWEAATELLREQWTEGKTEEYSGG